MKSQLGGVDPIPLLQQARELQALGYYVAAATTARSALEAFVLTKCDQVAYLATSRRGWRMYGRIRALRDQGIIEPEQAHFCFCVWLLGGSAAHGRPFDSQSIASAIEGLAAIFAKGGAQ